MPEAVLPPPETERVALPATAAPARRRPARWWTALGLLAVFLVFARSLGNDFTYDDKFLTRAFHHPGAPNTMIHELQPLRVYFTSPYWKGVSDSETLYRPVSILSYALTWNLLGRHLPEHREAFAQHLVNVLLYVLSVWLVFRLLVRAAGDTWASRLGALAFGVHAIHTEAVAGIVGRAEILSLCFGAAATLFYVQAREHEGRARAWRLVCASLFLFLAFGSKESALAWLPFVPVFALATTDPRQRKVKVELARALAIGIVPLALFFGLRHVALAELAADSEVLWAINPLAHEPAAVRIMTAVKVWAFALYKLLVPYPLVSEYGANVFDRVESVLAPWFLLSLATLGSAAWLACKSYRSRPLVFLALASFLGFSFMTSNVPIAIGTMFGERLLFVPSLGFAFAGAYLADRYSPSRDAGQLVHGTLALWMLACAALCVDRIGTWKNNLSLFVTDADAQPRSVRLQLNAARSLCGYGEHTGWKDYVRRALALEPGYAPAWWFLAQRALVAENWQQAEHYLNKGRAAKRMTARGDLSVFHLLRGELRVHQGRYEEACSDYAETIRLRALLFCDKLQRFDQLVAGKLTREQRMALYELGKERAPDKPEWDLHVGLLEATSGRYEAARRALSRAVGRLPASSLRFEARMRLAESLFALDRRAEAEREIETLLGDPETPPEILAEARSLAGRSG